MMTVPHEKQRKLLSCGCAPNSYLIENGKRIPNCIIHSVTDYKDHNIDLSKRLAKCVYGCQSSICPSRVDLPYFRYTPEKFYDEYACDCQSWD